jgi:hypothetical protein
MMPRRLLFLVVLLTFAPGCGGGGVKTAPVSGRVTLNGQPLANASVLFSPVPTMENNQPGPDAGGFTDSDGRYSLKLTGTQTKGAVIGPNKVRINLVPKNDPNDDTPQPFKRLPARYNSRNTELEFDVPAAGSDAADFPLTSP